jgi:hypothetical protein
MFFTLISISYSYTNISSCGQSLNIQGEEYRLNQSIVSLSGHCLTFTANDITLDCQGYTITGNYSDSSSSGIYTNNRDNLTIRNCNIQEFGSGMYIYSTSGSTFTNIVSTNNSCVGFSIESSSNNVFTSLTTRYNSNLSLGCDKVGIIIIFGSNNNTFSSITSSENNNYGIWITSNSNSNSFNSITVNDNAKYGLIISDSHQNSISLSQFNFNSWTGLRCLSSSYLTLSSITSSNNTDTGVSFNDCENSTISNSILQYNGDSPGESGIGFFGYNYNITVLNNDIRYNYRDNVLYDSLSSQYSINISFYNNYLGNSSLIRVFNPSDWSFYPSIFSGNYYTDYNGTGSICFIGSNSNCDLNPLEEIPLSSSAPSGSFLFSGFGSSIWILMLLLVGYFLF